VSALGLLALGCGGSNSTGPGPQITEITVSPDSVSLVSGGSVAFKAVAKSGPNGPAGGSTFFWSTSDSVIATVSQQGIVSAHQPGAAKIGASAQGMSGFARIIVVPAVVHSVVITPHQDTIYARAPNDTVTLQATTYDAFGNVLKGRPLFWSTNVGIVTVAGGLVTATANGAGTALVTATSPDSGQPADTARIVVRGHVAKSTVSPNFAWVSTSGSYFLPTQEQLSVQLIDSFGNDVTGQRQVKWTSGNRSVATVDSHGLVTAVATSAGSTQITATSPDSVKGSATITVFP
jgi:hypothetical protein